MKVSSSGTIIVVLVVTLIGGLVVEGARSIMNRYDFESTISRMEQVQHDLIEKQNHLIELLAIQEAAIPMIGSAAIQVERTSRTVDHEDLDFFCLAKNIFHEASIEDELGMFAIAQVTLNRVRSANYPNTICGVVMQPSQFSWTNDEKRKWTHPTGPKWDLSKKIARQVIKDGYRIPALQSAMFYHADYSSPAWSDPSAAIAQVGTHIFYASAR